MKYFKCVGYKKKENYFTIGKIYQVDDKLSEITSDTSSNGEKFTYKSSRWCDNVIEWLSDWYEFEEIGEKFKGISSCVSNSDEFDIEAFKNGKFSVVFEDAENKTFKDFLEENGCYCGCWGLNSKISHYYMNGGIMVSKFEESILESEFPDDTILILKDFVVIEKEVESKTEPEKEKTEFSKSDLASGMVVECRNGYRYLVVGEKLIRDEGFTMLTWYDENLVSELEDFNIDKVYRTSSGISLMNILRDDKLSLIWERKKEVESENSLAKKYSNGKIKVSPLEESYDEEDCDGDIMCFESKEGAEFDFTAFLSREDIKFVVETFTEILNNLK